MFDGTTLIVDVETLGENSYALSLPAEDLWVAYEVVRRHVDANGVRHYSQMTEAKTTADGYSFKFDTGDTFTCSSHLDRPTSSTLSDTAAELPARGANDKNKFLHTNASTGAVEWADAPNELPAVTDVDEGKVLTVNNSGVWVAANPSSGGGVLVVTDTDGTLDKTWQEIHDAMLSGGAVVERSVPFPKVSIVTGTDASEALNSYTLSVGYEGDMYEASSASSHPELQS